jgi:hypothetical protein
VTSRSNRLGGRAPDALQPFERIAAVHRRHDLARFREREPELARKRGGRQGLKGEHSASGYHVAC